MDQNIWRARLGATSKLSSSGIIPVTSPLSSGDPQKNQSQIVVGCGRPFHFPSLRGTQLRTVPRRHTHEGKIKICPSWQAICKCILQSNKPKSVMECASTGVRGFGRPFVEGSQMKEVIKAYSDVTISYDRRGNW
jgi:hypothetical protein